MADIDIDPDDGPDDFDDSGEWETCWSCGGEGGWHDCGEDCCPCAEPEINEVCNECDGRGRYRVPYSEGSNG